MRMALFTAHASIMLSLVLVLCGWQQDNFVNASIVRRRNLTKRRGRNIVKGGPQLEHYASAAGLKSKGDSNSSKGSPPDIIVNFETCAELIPTAASPAPELAVNFDLEGTCTTSFWQNEAPWINGSPLYVAYYPVCTCVILAKDCFLPAVSTFAPMYDVARSTSMSKEAAIDFASPFVEDDCLAYALAFLDQWAKDDEPDEPDNQEPPSND